MGGLGLLNGRVLDVTETLGTTRLGVGGQTDTQNGALLSEDITETVLSSAERKVTNEQSVGLGASRVAEVAGTLLGTVVTTLLAGSGVVQVDSTVVNLSALLGLVGLGGIGSVGELNVSESTGATRVTVGNNTARALAELGELALKPVLIDVPGQVTNEKVGRGTLGNISLGLLSGGLGLVISLALLGVLGGVLALLRLGLRVGAVGAVGAVRVGRLLIEVLVTVASRKQDNDSTHLLGLSLGGLRLRLRLGLAGVGRVRVRLLLLSDLLHLLGGLLILGLGVRGLGLRRGLGGRLLLLGSLLGGGLLILGLGVRGLRLRRGLRGRLLLLGGLLGLLLGLGSGLLVLTLAGAGGRLLALRLGLRLGRAAGGGLLLLVLLGGLLLLLGGLDGLGLGGGSGLGDGGVLDLVQGLVGLLSLGDLSLGHFETVKREKMLASLCHTGSGFSHLPRTVVTEIEMIFFLVLVFSFFF